MITKCPVSSFGIVLVNRKKLVFSLFFLQLFLVVGSVSAQEGDFSGGLPQIIPASPEPAAFVKSGVGLANTATGAMNASIPLYTIKIKDFTFPISLSYSTQGLKADEASSRVGHGWVLNATGMITRSVNGAPDESAPRMTLPTDFNNSSNDLFLWFRNAQGSGTGSGQDSQADEFQFNFNGHSGKFVIDNNGSALCTSNTNIKISVNLVTKSGKKGYVFLLVTPDGVTYHFGTNSETTLNHSFGRMTAYPAFETAYFLDRIDLPSGENITFDYLPISFTAVTGTTQTEQVMEKVVQPNYSCVLSPNMNSYTTTLDYITYNSMYLDEIATSQGLDINLSYVARPDASGDNRLTALDVTGVKKFVFEYFDVPFSASNPPAMGRFFLTKLRDVTLSATPGQSLDHTFTYEKLTQVPLPGTVGQDYLGYSNGSSIINLVPQGISPGTLYTFSNRAPNASYSILGTLRKIQYPTGGTETYFYEENSSISFLPRNDNIGSYELDGPGGTSKNVYANYNVIVPFDQKITLDTYAMDSNPFDEFKGDTAVKTTSVFIYDNGTEVGSRSSIGYTRSSTELTLLAGHRYQFVLWVYSYQEVGTATITYKKRPYVIYDTVNVSIPGVRLKQISYTDPFTSSSHSKYYTYASLKNRKWSSGWAAEAHFASPSVYKIFCSQGWVLAETDVYLTTYTSSSTAQNYGYSSGGSPIYYTTVIESDSPDLVNGGTQYTYYPNDDGARYSVVHGAAIPNIPTGQRPTLAGMVYQTLVFNSNGETVKFDQEDYETIGDDSRVVSSVYVRQLWDPTFLMNDSRICQDGTEAVDEKMQAFDAVKIDFVNWWKRLKTKTTIQDGVTTVTNYSYGSSSNILPVSVTTTDSKGNSLVSTMVYPNTYSATDNASQGYNALTSKNIVTPVVVQSSYLNGNLQQQKQVFYADWLGTGSIVTPSKIQVKESPADVLHDAIIFSSYSAAWNPLQLQKANDVAISYIWDEKLSLPIAQVKNASSNQIAYSGFENNAFGNWVPQSGWDFSNQSFTGTQSFTGSMQFTIPVNGPYVISFWTPLPAVVKNGASILTGKVVRSVTSNSTTWNLYQFTVTVSNITNQPSTWPVISVSGTSIDEARLLPSNAAMESFTYKPFVGLWAKSDLNCMPTYFYYDNAGRLTSLADFKGSVLKTYEYHFQQP